MSDVVPACYERGAFFKEWANETVMEGPPTIRARLIEERGALLESIEWEAWNPEESKRLALLDYVLGI